MSAVILRPIIQTLKTKNLLRGAKGIPLEIILLAILGLVWGFLYGAIMNLWQWPFIVGTQGQSWVVGLGFRETLQRYLAYYLVTSLLWDTIAAIGNVLLIFAFGIPTLKALRRFQQRFTFSYTLDDEVISLKHGVGTLK
jgi:energy-coupling factor transport system substrate-specific component